MFFYSLAFVYMLYLRIMRSIKLFFEIILLVVLLAALTLVTLYQIHRDVIDKEILTRTSSELSRLFEHPVKISSINYLPFQSIALGGIEIFPSDLTVKIDTATIAFDLLSIAREKRLKTTIVLRGLRTNGFFCDVTLKTDSMAAEAENRDRAFSIKKALSLFDPNLIRSIFITEANIRTKGIFLEDIFGTLDIAEAKLSKGKIHLMHKNTPYLIDIKALDTTESGYDLSLRSDDLGLNTILVKENNTLSIKKLTGMFYTLHFNLIGAITGFFSGEKKCTLGGTTKTEIGSLTSIGGELGEFVRNAKLSGRLESTFHLETSDLSLENCKVAATMSTPNLKIGKIYIGEVTSELDFTEGVLQVSPITAAPYDGTLDGDFTLDTKSKDLPYSISCALEKIDLKKLIRDAVDPKTRVHGLLETEIFISGSANTMSSINGSAKVAIDNANLGPMPLLTPLLGDMLSSVQTVFSFSGKIDIDRAYADFEIKDQKITTDNLTFVGKSIYVTSEGYLDFDGNLDFSFENQFRQPDPDAEEDWQVALRDTVVRFGKVISKARLKGTVKKPEWSFDYINPLKNIFKKSIKNFLGISQ